MPSADSFRNAILSRLGPADLDLLRPRLERMDLPTRYRLADANQRIDNVYFLEEGVASTTAHVRGQTPSEIGIIGREGMVNLAVPMAAGRSPNDTFMQIAGSGMRLTSEALEAAMRESPLLTRLLLQFTHVFMVQTASTVLANTRASVAERLARWLLMAHDRTDSDWVPLTHEFLSMMLGVRRAGVTTALRALEQDGLIERDRGRIAIRDRKGLLHAANGYYGFAESEIRRLFGNSVVS